MSDTLSSPVATLAVPSVPTDDRHTRLMGLSIVFVAFAGFGVWGATARLDSAVVAPGVVMVESYRKTVQHLEGGIVKDILVRDGDSVHAGDILLRLDETQARASLEIARSKYLATRALEARLSAERDLRQSIAFPEELLRLQGGDPRVQEILDGQGSVFRARHDALQSEISVLGQRVKQLQVQMSGLDTLQQTEQQRILSLKEEVNDIRKLFKKGYVDKGRVRALERTIAELQGERAKHLADIAQAQVQIGETQLHILQLRKRFLSDVVTELRDTQTEIFDLEERMRALEDTLLRTEIRAPTNGTVVGLGVHTVGGVISPSIPILEIVPQGEPLVVEARVQPTDIDNVHAGLPADARFSAFQARITPVVEGRVVTVSADRLLDPSDQMPYYLARVQVTPQGMERLQ
nr:HlyD family type I secretion periplasmic adaptor subunit [Gammaproteobacteria bacterium]